VNPSRVDTIVDLIYGLLIAVSVGLIVVAGNAIGLAFGFGVLVAYILHVGWKMARFDPDWMTRAVKGTVEETVDETVGQTVEGTVEEKVDETVDETVQEKVDETVADTVGEAVDETVEETVPVEKTSGEQSPGDGTDAETDRKANGEEPESEVQ